MATIAPPKKALGKVLVIGGCGFLGHHIVNLLHESYSCSIAVLDLRTVRNRRPEADGVQYFEADITSLSAVLQVFTATTPDVVIHTASPTLMGAPRELYKKVNVDGTRFVIEACQQTNVKALVYTSSASIISDNVTDLINADERWPIIPAKWQTEYYSQTKAEAEALVLAANRAPSHPELLTCSLRPAGIFGEGDMQQLPNILNAFYTGKTGFQLGDNTNLFDFTYVGNVAHAHCLAAIALFYTSKLSTVPLSHEKVDGESFFVTNDQPVYFWDYVRAVWKAAGCELGTEHVWTISHDIGMSIGAVLEWGMWMIGRTPSLSRKQVKYSCMTRYYDCGKAKSLLGYRPVVGLQEGIEKTVKFILHERQVEVGKTIQ